MSDRPSDYYPSGIVYFSQEDQSHLPGTHCYELDTWELLKLGARAVSIARKVRKTIPPVPP